MRRDAAQDLTGTSLGRYLLVRRLGQGGMGVVYEAEDHLLNRRVAVKLLPYAQRPPARLLERFFVEAQVAARLNHPNIIGIFDIGERSGTFYIVLELLNELSLGGYVRRYGALSWQEATRIAADCCAALHDAHLVGLVHRDIKPDNILCSPAGTVKVADFGLVKELQHSNPEGAELTQEDAVIGSPQYMSPEQCRSVPVDSRSDIYSLGATYYTMLTGRPPFGFGVPMELMVHHCGSPTPDPREHYPEIPTACVDILNRAMEKSPDDRYLTAEEMRTALEAVLDGVSKVSYAFLTPSSSPRQATRQRQPAELAAALEAEHGDGPTMDSGAANSDGTSDNEKPSPPPSKRSARLANDDSSHDGEHDSSDEKRMALLEAALAMAPTAPITPPSKKQVQRRLRRRAAGRYVMLGLMALLVLTLVGGQFMRLLSDDSGAKAAVRPTVKVGILHSLSGPMSPVTRPVADATLLAIDELNDQGGLLGRLIEAVVVDGKSDVESFATAAERLLLREKAQVLFGGGHADGRRGIRQVVELHDQLLLYPGDAEGLEESPNIFYLGGVPSQRIAPALRYSVETLGNKRFYLLGSDLLNSRAMNAMISDDLRELGGKVVGERLVPLSAPDFAGLIRKMAAAEPELVISTLRGDANVSFFRAWEKRDKKLRDLHVLSLSLDENILTLLDGVDMSQNYLASSYFQVVPRAENTQFIERFRKKYGAHHVVTEAMEAAYSSVYLWAQAVRAANDFQPAAVRKMLRAQQYDAPSGRYKFDEMNHAWKAFHLVRIAPGNKLELLTSSPTLLRPQLFPASRTPEQWESLYGRL